MEIETNKFLIICVLSRRRWAKEVETGKIQ